MAVPAAVFVWFIAYSLCCPTAREGQGFIMGYPMYKEHEYMVIHVIGTWFWLYTSIMVCSRMLNSKFNDRVYKVVVGASMYTYISHYTWLLLAMHIVLGARLNLWTNTIVMLILMEIFVFASYGLLVLIHNKVSQLCQR